MERNGKFGKTAECFLPRLSAAKGAHRSAKGYPKAIPRDAAIMPAHRISEKEPTSLAPTGATGISQRCKRSAARQ